MSYGKNAIGSKEEKKKGQQFPVLGRYAVSGWLTRLMNENHPCPRAYVRIFDLEVLHPAEFGKES